MAIRKIATPVLFTERAFLPVIENIQYWQKDLSNYLCHLFILPLEKESEFADLWEAISARIAVGFQTELQPKIEMWNIYLIFLVKEKVSRELKYKIEQDKFCSRKLVEDNLGPVAYTEDFIQNLVDRKIFTLEILENKQNEDYLNNTTENLINKEDANVIAALKDFESSNKMFEKFYNRYKKLNNEAKKH